MNKGLTIATICLLAILTVVLTGILILGINNGGIMGTYNNKNIEVKSEKLSLTGIEKINLDFKRADTKIILSDDSEVKVVQYAAKKIKDKYLFKTETSGSTLNIKDTSKNSFCIGFCFTSSVRYEIYIPRTYHKDFEMNYKTGDINFAKDSESFNFSSLKLVGTTSDITFNNSLKTGKLEIKNTTGDINIDEVVSNNVDIRFTTADLDIASIKSNETTIKGTTGDINIQNLETELDMNLTTGDIKIGNFNIIGDSQIKATTGDMDIDLAKEANCNIVIDSTFGDRKLPNDSSLVGNGKYKFNIKTTTGDIRVK